MELIVGSQLECLKSGQKLERIFWRIPKWSTVYYNLLQSTGMYPLDTIYWGYHSADRLLSLTRSYYRVTIWLLLSFNRLQLATISCYRWLSASISYYWPQSTSISLYQTERHSGEPFGFQKLSISMKMRQAIQASLRLY